MEKALFVDIDDTIYFTAAVVDDMYKTCLICLEHRLVRRFYKPSAKILTAPLPTVAARYALEKDLARGFKIMSEYD